MANSGRPQLPSAVCECVCACALVCVSVYVPQVCASAHCMHVQECLHKCLSACVWKELKPSGLAIMSARSKQGRWRD